MDSWSNSSSSPMFTDDSSLSPPNGFLDPLLNLSQSCYSPFSYLAQDGSGRNSQCPSSLSVDTSLSESSWPKIWSRDSPDSMNSSFSVQASSPWPHLHQPITTSKPYFPENFFIQSNVKSVPPQQQEYTPRLPSSVDYYPNFDPREYFCDTVAVENASMVAQIVGKRGAKIKHLVAKYGTRIRTPNPDQEPVFIIKGKRADVYRVKQEIVSAAEHFMQIERNKKIKLDSVLKGLDPYSVKLYIPNRYVGLVIGRNGRIVRDLQTAHRVYIETPKFNVREFFVIHGSEENLLKAVKFIENLLCKSSGIDFSDVRVVGNEVHFIE